MQPAGQIASLHIHPPVAGEPLINAAELTLVAEKGVKEDKRYFGRRNSQGRPSKRQVTLIEREVVQSHSTALGIADFDPGQVRSNIETTGIDLASLLGRDVRIGEAILHFIEPRTPCHKMDALAKGLRAVMENGCQGVIATVIQSGLIRAGDPIVPIPLAPPSQSAPN